MPSLIIIATVLVLIATPYLQSLLSQWRRREKEKQFGCLPINVNKNSLPWGYDNHRAWLKAAKSGTFNRRNIELFDRYGWTYESNIFNTRYIYTRDMENIKTMLAIKTEDYGKEGIPIAKPYKLMLGSGLNLVDGPSWKRSRELVTPLFTRAEVGDIQRLKRHVDNLFAHIPRDGSSIDLAPLLAKYAIDNSTEFIFGHSAGTLADEPSEGKDFFDKFEQAKNMTAQRGYIAGGRFMFLQKGTEYKWLQACKKLHEVVDGWAARAIDSSKPYANGKSHPRAPDNHQHYILIREMAKEISDPAKLRSELLNIYSPSRGMVPTLLSNIYFYLARHPDIWKQLRKQALDLGDTPITFEVIKSLTFFRHVAQEAIRLQGPSGEVHRLAKCDTVLPHGGGPDGKSSVFVPMGTVVIGNNFPNYHDPNVWGDDVEEFRPSRFEGKVFNNWSYMPFLGGPRICPAQPFVWTTAVYLMYRMVREFETMENKDPCLDYIEAVAITAFSKNGVLVALHPAPGN